MSIRWDSLLVHHLARELTETLGSARLRALRLDARTRDLVLFFRDRTLLWRLHPNRGVLLMRDPVAPQDTDLRMKARVRAVRSLPDERVLVFELTGERSGAGPWELIVELLGNQLNAIVTEGKDRTIRHVLRTREGKRPTKVGQPYIGPEPTTRLGLRRDLSREEWVRLMEPVPPSDRVRELMRAVAWVSPMNADAFLPTGSGRQALEAGYDAWLQATAVGHETQPVVLETDRGPQPYPMPLDGITSHEHASLVEAIAACATTDETQGDSTASLAIGPELFERLSDAAAQAERRVVRLIAELDGRPDADAARSLGDLILARYQDILPGAESVTLTDFEGQEVQLDLDPKLPPHENAAVFYDRAARSERAAARMPAIIAKAAGERDRLLAMVARMNATQATPDEIRAILPPAPARQRRGQQTPSRPYRSFRSSGGLEIRVGRGARHNDDLTFRHSAPDDVWLHARHTAGAHVILRWTGSDAPPARDLQEAGILAALYSKARTSSSVPVDWTRRKHVRKPRGSAAGSVLPDRVKTIFVRPDEKLLESLSEET